MKPKRAGNFALYLSLVASVLFVIGATFNISFMLTAIGGLMALVSFGLGIKNWRTWQGLIAGLISAVVLGYISYMFYHFSSD